MNTWMGRNYASAKILTDGEWSEIKRSMDFDGMPLMSTKA